MSDYTLSAKITGDSKSFNDAFEKAQNKMKTFNKRVDSFGKNLQSSGKHIMGIGGKLSLMTSPLLLLGKSVFNTGQEFEASMSKVQAISGATGKDLETLESTAREMGQNTRYSASEAADGLSYMALAGWETKEMVAGLPAVLDLATAGEMELARASEVVTGNLNAYGLEAQDAARVSDVLAYAQANSGTSAEQLASALEVVAPAASAAGHEIEDTAAIIGILADQNIKGSKAGTYLNSMYTDIAKSAENGAIAIGNQSVAVYDANGNMREMTDIVADVDKATEGMSGEQRDSALMAVFQQQSLKGVNALLNAQEGDLSGLKEGLENADGAAERMALTMDSNLQGKVMGLGSSFDELKLRLFDVSEGPMNSIVTKITELVDWFSSLDDGVLSTIAAIAAIAVVAGPVIMILGGMVTAVGTLISVGAGLMAFLFNPITLIVGAIVGLGAALIDALVPGDTFLEKLKTIGTYIMDMSGNIIPMFQDAFSRISEVISTVAGVIGETFGPTFEAIKTAMMDLAVSAIPLITNAFMTFMNIVMSVGLAVSNIASAVFPVLLGIFNALVPVIASVVTIFMDIGTQVMAMASKLVTALMPTITSVITTVMNIVQTVAPAVIAIINAIIAVIKAMIPIIMSIISTVVTVMSSVISSISPIVAFVGGIINAVMAVISPIVAFVANVIASVVSVIGTIIGAVTSTFNTVFSVISGVFNSVFSFIAGIINKVSGVISKVSSTVSTVFNTIYNTVSSVMSRVGSAVTGTMSGIQNAWSGLTGFVSGVVSGISTAFSSLVSSVKGAVNKVTGGINSAIGIINKIPGVSIGKIPQLARGTDDWAGGFAKMNEGGRGELTYLPGGSVVVPHDISMKYAKESAKINNNYNDNANTQSSNQYINVSLKDANIYDTRDIKEISKDLATQISREVSFG